MLEHHLPLWSRIQTFEFDEPGAAMPFTRRLARRYGWTRRYTLRVVEEYRRFVMLATMAGHTACPSEAVDEAWHLHLTCTRSYWQRFCPEVLSAPLHHEPTRGGIDEQLKHRAMYEQTLRTYREVFGEDPPRDVWPGVSERFDPRRQARPIVPAEYWILPRRPVWRAARQAAMFIAAVIAAGCAPAVLGVANPLEMRGPEFLRFYAVAIAAGLGAAMWLRHTLRRAPASEIRAEELTPWELAFLRSGPRLAVNAAIAALARDGAVELADTQRHRVKLGQATPLSDDPFLMGVYQAVRDDGR